ncbi:MAG: hypothetical protein QXP01_08925 [Candidatus Hadarchaeum sp.]
MAEPTIWRIRSYKLYQYAAGYRYRNRDIKALILLFEDGGPRKIFAYFTDQGTLPPNEIEGERYIGWYTYDQFGPVVEMLREESPIYAQVLIAGDAPFLALATDAEPVGEGEKVSSWAGQRP